MSNAPLLAASNIMDHLTPQYSWHTPGWGPHGGSIDLWSWNLWIESLIGINPGIHTHIVMMWFASLTVLFFFVPIARKFVLVPTGMRNFLEPVLLFIRDEMVYPNMGEKDGRTYLPYFWSIFFFILACNLIGLLPSPFGITATGNFNVTGALAVMTLMVGIVGGTVKKGLAGYWLGLIPPGMPPGPGGFVLKVFIFFLEVIGLIARHVALMIRLFANMTAGHAILAVLAMWLTFTPAFAPIRVFQAMGSTAMILFEIFIALVQAYIFTILSAIYIGLSLAEEH
ncbi:MAG: F0F1 ATP synthase subunit A [Planctomycetota bacterium]